MADLIVEYQRADRVGDLLAELISDLLRKEIRDPRISAMTVTAVKVSKDLRHARVYFNLLGRQDERKDASAGLKSATGFIRSKIAKQLKLRFVPTLEFCYDDTEDEAERIDSLLKQVKS
jgi:ribosome-binding factor A